MQPWLHIVIVQFKRIFKQPKGVQLDISDSCNWRYLYQETFILFIYYKHVLTIFLKDNFLNYLSSYKKPKAVT
jgi:hypothetical protein